MSELEKCSCCQEQKLEPFESFWYFGWRVILYKCQNCQHVESKSGIKLIPSWLHFWLKDFSFGLRKRFFEIDCDIRYFLKCVKSGDICDIYQNSHNKYNSRQEILFWMQQTYLSLLQGRKG